MQITLCIIIFAAAMIAFITLNKKVPISVIAISAMVLLVFTGCLDKKTALGCFGNANVVMLGGMFIVSEGLNRTQMANYLNVNRSSMARELSSMKKEGLIDFDQDMFILKK